MVGTVPVEAVASKADAEVVVLGTAGIDPPSLTTVVVEVAAEDREHPQQHALVGDTVEMVELRCQTDLGVRGIQAAVGRHPERHLILCRPRGGGGGVDIVGLPVALGPAAVARGVRLANAEDPLVAERVEEDRGPIAAAAAPPMLARPVVDAVGRCAVDEVADGAAAVGEELDAPLRVFLIQVEPNRVRFGCAALEDDVGPLDDIELGLDPSDPVLRLGVAEVLVVAAHVPGLELPVGRVEPDASAKRHGHGGAAWLFPFLVGLQDRVGRVGDGPVVGTGESGLLDQEVIKEQLAALVDRKDGRGSGEVRGRGQCVREGGQPGRPGGRQPDPVRQGVGDGHGTDHESDQQGRQGAEGSRGHTHGYLRELAMGGVSSAGRNGMCQDL